MTDQYLNTNQLKHFAPNSPILAFRPMDMGSPQEDWCNHLQENPRYRRELEEFSILGDVVVRIADGIEPKPYERVKILSLEYAVKTLKNETDAKEFVRCVKAIASPDAGQWELEQIAAYYYGEIRRRSDKTHKILKEMGLLGMQMEAVTATINELEVGFVETETEDQKLTVADQRRVRKAQKSRPSLPDKTPNYDEELKAVHARVRTQKTTCLQTDAFADFYLDDKDKSLEQLDADFMSFQQLEQYDENGVIGFSMSGGQHAVVVYQTNMEVDSSYLPVEMQGLAREMNLIFIGHKLGGLEAQKARRFVLEQRILRREMQAINRGFPCAATDIPTLDKFSNMPFSQEDFSEWLSAKLEYLYPYRTLRTIRRLATNKAGFLYEYSAKTEVNPDFEEMQYVSSICQILWNQMRSDFHLRSLRNSEYQNLHFSIRRSNDTAEVSRIKKRAYQEFKEQKKLSLKEFTSLNTAAKSQEARLANKVSFFARKTLKDISKASANRIRYFKFYLYNDEQIQALTRQEKQQLWDAIRSREEVINNSFTRNGSQTSIAIQQPLFQLTNPAKQIVRVKPQSVK